MAVPGFLGRVTYADDLALEGGLSEDANPRDVVDVVSPLELREHLVVPRREVLMAPSTPLGARGSRVRTDAGGEQVGVRVGSLR